MTSVENTSKVASSSSSSGSTVISSSAKKQQIPSTYHPIFKEILPILEKQTKLAIRLPTYIPESEGSYAVHAILENVDVSEYQILLGLVENCNGGNACRLGNILAEAITPESSELIGKTVTLTDGIEGYFVDATCGANCSDSTLTWEQNSVRYTVGIKAGKVESLVKMANSAIASF